MNSVLDFDIFALNTVIVKNLAKDFTRTNDSNDKGQ